jgi:hypothetical protein
VLLSILVPTLAARQRLFERIFGELETQIDKSGLRGEVEILTLADQGEMPIGEKRNLLVARSRGEFIAFVDDDDMVSEDYLRSIVEALRRRPDVDCVGIRVLMFFRGRHPRHVAHSVRYTELGRHGVEYRRPPYILNPIRRSIAQRYPFSNLRYQEDLEWAMRMSRDGALRNEVFIDQPIYYYYSRRWFAVQWLLDKSETIRYRLGLRVTSEGLGGIWRRMLRDINR